MLLVREDGAREGGVWEPRGGPRCVGLLGARPSTRRPCTAALGTASRQLPADGSPSHTRGRRALPPVVDMLNQQTTTAPSCQQAHSRSPAHKSYPLQKAKRVTCAGTRCVCASAGGSIRAQNGRPAGRRWRANALPALRWRCVRRRCHARPICAGGRARDAAAAAHGGARAARSGRAERPGQPLPLAPPAGRQGRLRLAAPRFGHQGRPEGHAELWRHARPERAAPAARGAGARAQGMEPAGAAGSRLAVAAGGLRAREVTT
jgi:hypothetical protein